MVVSSGLVILEPLDRFDAFCVLGASRGAAATMG
jgi:hypothetical protein